MVVVQCVSTTLSLVLREMTASAVAVVVHSVEVVAAVVAEAVVASAIAVAEVDEVEVVEALVIVDVEAHQEVCGQASNDLLYKC